MEKIIEMAGGVEAAWAVAAAAQAYSKVDSQGQWNDGVERVTTNHMFERMIREKPGTFGKDKSLPLRFVKAVGATESESHEEESTEELTR